MPIGIIQFKDRLKVKSAHAVKEMEHACACTACMFAC